MPEQKSIPIEAFFPVGGIVENVNHKQQPPQTYADGLNVLPFDSIEDRARGGQRFGTSKYIDAAINGSAFIQKVDRTVEFVDPGTVVIQEKVAEDLFNFADGFVSARDSALWVEDRGSTAVAPGPQYPTTYLEWGNASMNSDGRDARFIVSGNLLTCDWTSDALLNSDLTTPWPNGDAAATTNNEWRILRQNGGVEFRLYPPDVTIPPGGKTDAVIRLNVITSSTGETAGNYMTGIVFRLDAVTGGEYFAIGWRKPEGGATQEIALIDDTGADVTTAISLSGSPDDGTHQLELRVAGDIIEVIWDGETQLWGGTDTTYDLSGDGLGTAIHRHVGIYHHRLRASGTWTNAVIGGADNWQFFSAEESPGLRSEKLLVVSGGSIYVGDVDSGMNLAVSGADQLVATSRFIASVFAFQKVYLLDGVSYHQYTLSSNTVGSWSADGASILPGGDAGPDSPNVPRGTIIVLWQGRLVISGLATDQTNVFFSAIGEPDNWDYNANMGDSDAVELGTGLALGQVGDIVTALIPDRGNRLIIGGENSISVLRGNPAVTDASSPFYPQILTVSKSIGVAGGSRAWAFSPDGTIFFWGPNGLYTLPPQVESQASSLSAANKVSAGRLDKTFRNIDLSANQVQMLWDTDADGLWIFITPMDQTQSGRHYFFDRRTGGFHPLELPLNHGPTAVFDFRADKPSTAGFLMGGTDSFLRKWDRDAGSDDGTTIASTVLIGPFISPFPGREHRFSKVIATLAEGSDSLQYAVQVGDTAEAAKTAPAAYSGTWVAGLNPPVFDRARGGAAYIRLTNSDPNRRWAIESIMATLTAAGPIRPR